MKKLSCLYTNQKAKKRKRWEDGSVAIHSSGLCVLHANHATALAPLDSRFLPAAQAQQIIDGNLREIEFDGYLVEVNEETFAPPSAQRNLLPQTVPKFKIPASRPLSKVSVSVSREDFDCPQIQPSIPHESYTSGGKGRYQVSEEELDSIWGATHSSCNATTMEEQRFSKTLESTQRILPHRTKENLRDPQQRSIATDDFVQLEDDSDEDFPSAELPSRRPLHNPVQCSYPIGSIDEECNDYWGNPAFTM